MKTGRPPILQAAIASHIEKQPMTVTELSNAIGKSRGAIGSSLSLMEQKNQVRRRGRPYKWEMIGRAA